MRTIVWFRGRDLRLEDQPALAAARGEVIPLLVVEPERPAAPFRDAFEASALAALDAGLRRLGSALAVRRGDPERVLPDCVQAWKVERVETLARVEPWWRERDRRLETALGALGCRLTRHAGDTLVPPGSVRTASGTAFAVFTPFRRAFLDRALVPAPLPAPTRLPSLPPDVLAAVSAWAGEPAGTTADQRMRAFLEPGLAGYAQGRDQLGLEGTSHLSADLRAGTLSVRRLWQAVSARLAPGGADGPQVFRDELLWREFAHHTLWDRPDLVEQPFRPAWLGFPWREDPEALAAWREGRTGYPVVDAAARELLATGFVHNRARMVAASFLCKHLLLSWRQGEAHYRALLADGCAAANGLNWQWAAGCGVDAQPWFRIFNPSAQGCRFDPDGAYVRRWVPELAAVPDAVLTGPPGRISVPGYPPPIVDHSAARQRFLDLARSFLRGAPGDRP